MTQHLASRNPVALLAVGHLRWPAAITSLSPNDRWPAGSHGRCFWHFGVGRQSMSGVGPSTSLITAYCRPRWTSIGPTLGWCIVFAGIRHRWEGVMGWSQHWLHTKPSPLGEGLMWWRVLRWAYLDVPTMQYAFSRTNFYLKWRNQPEQRIEEKSSECEMGWSHHTSHSESQQHECEKGWSQSTRHHLKASAWCGDECWDQPISTYPTMLYVFSRTSVWNGKIHLVSSIAVIGASEGWADPQLNGIGSACSLVSYTSIDMAVTVTA